MKTRNYIVICLLGALVIAIAGCASTKVTDRNELVYGQLPKPNTIWVYDFAATPDDVPDESALSGKYSEHDSPQTTAHIEAGRELGTEIAAQLVQQVRAMGLNAARAMAGTTPQINDLVIRGYLVSFKKGDAAERIFIGFGSGASDLKVAVEGFQMTSHGLRKLGGGKTDAEGAKTPGADLGALSLIATHNPLGLIVSTGMKIYGQESGKSTIKGREEQTVKEIADVLKKRFQEQEWID